MKKTIVLFIAFAAGLSMHAQKLKKSEVPQNLTGALKQIYPGAKDIQWEKEKTGNYEVEFENGETEQSVTFDPAGNILETEIEILFSELPEPAKNYLSKNFKGSKMKEASKITDSKGLVNYEAELKDKDLIFDSTGKFIREED